LEGKGVFPGFCQPNKNRLRAARALKKQKLEPRKTRTTRKKPRRQKGARTRHSGALPSVKVLPLFCFESMQGVLESFGPCFNKDNSSILFCITALVGMTA
jgi:hypothetical protein